MLPFQNNYWLACIATVLFAFPWLVQAEETHSKVTHPEEVQSGEAVRSELVFELDPYYTNVDYNVPLSGKPIPTITSDSEAVIYSELIKDSLIPRFMVLEASVYPLASAATYIKSHSPHLYRQAEIGRSGINLFESATAGFQEPWAVSAFSMTANSCTTCWMGPPTYSLNVQRTR